MIEFADFWTNDEILLFLHQRLVSSKSIRQSDAEYLYLGAVAIEKIWWREPERARLILMGPMPNAALLFDLKNGDSILLLRKICGDPAAFCADEVVMVCHNCQIRRKWLLNLSPNFLEQEVVCIYVSLDCRFEIVDKEEGDA